MSVIICGFSGIGKSSAAKSLASNNRWVFDFESSDYSHNPDGTFNDAFPGNYIDALEESMTHVKGDYYFLSCHQSVRDELTKRGIKYIIVMPQKEHRNEYLKRWLKRGSSVEFISNMNAHWYDMIDSCIEDYAPTIVLDEHEYLADVLKLYERKRLNS